MSKNAVVREEKGLIWKSEESPQNEVPGTFGPPAPKVKHLNGPGATIISGCLMFFISGVFLPEEPLKKM